MQLDIKFINFTLLKINFSVNQEYKGNLENITVAPYIKIGHELREKEKQLVVILGLKLNEGDIPYSFEIEAGGIFQLENIPEERTVKQLSTINCPAILFPFMRETIADLTRRAGFPPLLLKPINFIEFAKEQQAKQN